MRAVRHAILWAFCWLLADIVWARPYKEDIFGPDDGEPSLSGSWNADGALGILYIMVAGLAVAFLPKRLWYMKALAIGWPALYLVIAIAVAKLR